MARKDEIPSLENALESGFSELKSGEQNIKVEKKKNQSKKNDEYDRSYGLKIDAEENRERFISKPIKATKTIVEKPIDSKVEQKKVSSTPVDKNKKEILDSPTSNIGDDFDVSW